MDTNSIRARYRPDRIRVLFVGESPPAGGTFFYRGNSKLARYTSEALIGSPPTPEDLASFPALFRDLGFYLVDLCDEPVNHLNHRNRMATRRAGVTRLADEMRRYHPSAVIAVMKAIRAQVVEACCRAGLSGVPVHVLPFPAFGRQIRFVQELRALLPSLLHS